jgi:dienelactone hydrolase
MARLTRRSALALLGGIAAGADVNQEIREMADHAPLTMQFKGGTAAECRDWQRRFTAKLDSLLGPYRPPAQWQVTVERIVELPDHRREELLLRAEGVRDLPVYLLIPHAAGSSKRAGILALHGHGPLGYDAVAGIGGTAARDKEIRELNYDYGLQLVRRGYVVAAPCFTPFGRRVDDETTYPGKDACATTFVRMQLLGKLLMAENLRDAIWALDLLARQEQVDNRRLGCVGLSTGGRMTMMTSALDNRIRVAVISGALNVMQERISNHYDCGAQVIPGLLNYGDVPEIASLIAPRPVLWEVGNHDGLMVKDRIGPALERMRRAWRAFDALDNLQVDFFEGRHEWHGLQAYPLLEKVLRPTA